MGRSLEPRRHHVPVSAGRAVAVTAGAVVVIAAIIVVLKVIGMVTGAFFGLAGYALVAGLFYILGRIDRD